MRIRGVFLSGLAVSMALLGAPAAHAKEYGGVVIRLGAQAKDVERNVAGILADRLSRLTGLGVSTVSETDVIPAEDSALTVLLGRPEHHGCLMEAMKARRMSPLTALDPGPEGFHLRHAPAERLILAAGIDDRGVLYAVGELLRQAVIRDAGVDVPDGLDVRTAPAFEVRGTQFGQSGVAKQKGKVRDWTQAEAQETIINYALAGANTMQVPEEWTADEPMYQFMKSLGLKMLAHYTPNVGNGPPEWQAAESIGRPNYLCPSVPEARKRLLEIAEATFSKSADMEYVRLVGGDGGGCECDRCDPFGGTFILLCEDVAGIIHKYHPKTEIFITNQKFDNADDLAIFKYLQEKPRPWLRAFCYGPGSDAMSWQPGHRQTHRMDLFEYPGFGPFSRYLHEILHQLPPEQDLVFFNEITHWRYAQHAFVQAYPRPDRDGHQPPPRNHFIYERMPDRALTLVYDRLTFYAWPRFYHWVFGETVRYGIGDVTHSSGTHDHFNQWMWQRLMWNPQTKVEDVVDEYARTWFGPEAAPLMAKALFLLEQYLQHDPKRPLPMKEELTEYYRLVKAAGNVMPAHVRKSNWLWLEFAQKGSVDRYTQLNVAQQMALQARIEQRIANAMHSGELDAGIDEVLPWFDVPRETAEMKHLREEAVRYGEESNALFGVRSEGIYSLEHDFIGLGWLKRQLERARAASGDDRRELLAMIVDYENAGEGGFYDNCGTYENAPHLVNGYPYDHGQPIVPEMMDEGNRWSQRTMCYTQQEPQGVTFQYDDLDPKARYRVRFTLVRPKFQERYAMRMNQRTQTIYADDAPLAKDVELPERMSDFFTYDIPAEATADGSLTLRFEKAPDVAAGDRVSVEQWRNTGGWGTLVSEVWLMKRP